jgi:hypothetical protein
MAKHPYPWHDAFLASLRSIPVVARACEAVEINRTTAYRAREADPAFAEDWDAAMEDGVDRAESEAFRRGVAGFEEPVVHQGRISFRHERYEDEEGGEHWRLLLDDKGQPIPLTTRKHSDALLNLILKGRRKKVYADRTELTGADGAPMQIDETTRSARVAQLLAMAERRKADADQFGDLA